MKNPDWTIIENSILEDERLSWEAKGILGFLYSRPDDWEYDPIEVFLRSENVEEAIDALLLLDKHGYLQEFKARNETDLKDDSIWGD